jgi:hypothetical protein
MPEILTLQRSIMHSSSAHIATNTAPPPLFASGTDQQLLEQSLTDHVDSAVPYAVCIPPLSTPVCACRRNKEAVYKFSKVFQQDAGQNDVYDGTTASLVCQIY